MPRDHILTIRLSDEEHEALREGAEEVGTSVSDYVRRLLGDPSRAVITHTEEVIVQVPRRADAIRQARIIGRNLWALVRGNSPTDPLKIEQIRALARELLA